jgi:hypothetical protein
MQNNTEQCNCGSDLSAEPIFDARGIYLTRACPECRKQKLSRFRKDVLHDPNYWVDEPIDPE